MSDPIEVKPGKGSSEALGKLIALVVSITAAPLVAWVNAKLSVTLDPVEFTGIVIALIAAATGLSIKFTGSRTAVKVAAANAAADVQVAQLTKDTASIELGIAKVSQGPELG